ncbi:unnamed protein product [Blepharisma stoltei]|uniref:Uncharacterized protein n=1 Tax=Blepharisma stoltei TaxID=1481888 RepID=A0AAU9J9D8_9CILI|nr:unnamed protein product [Blepharisma stoltei]
MTSSVKNTQGFLILQITTNICKKLIIKDQNCSCDANAILTTDGCDFFCEYWCSTCRGQEYFSCLEFVKGKLVDNAYLYQYLTKFKA